MCLYVYVYICVSISSVPVCVIVSSVGVAVSLCVSLEPDRKWLGAFLGINGCCAE